MSLDGQMVWEMWSPVYSFERTDGETLTVSFIICQQKYAS